MQDYQKTLFQIANFLNLKPKPQLKDLRMKNVPALKRKGLNLLNKLGLYKLKRSSVSYRKGITGDWKNYFNEEMIRDLDSFVSSKLKKYNYFY
jgi:hypothetical protein